MATRLSDAIAWTRRAKEAQAWSDERFEGLLLCDFEVRVHFFASATLEAPPGFEVAWTAFSCRGPERRGPLLSEEAAIALDAIVFLFDPSQTEQLDVLREHVSRLDGIDAPPVLLLPHTVTPGRRGKQDAMSLHLCEELLGVGVDWIAPGEVAGFELALVVQSAVAQLTSLTGNVEKLIESKRAAQQNALFLKECTDDMLWMYGRARVASSVPILDGNVTKEGLPKSLDQRYNIQDVLGQGACGTVFLLQSRSGGRQEVLKSLEKSKITDFDALRSLHRQTEVMKLLSSDEHRHSKVIELYEVYHTPSHVLFRMEFGGTSSLYHRLASRERSGNDCRPLSVSSTQSLVEQAVAAIAHLHMGPNVSHRDIKPENFVVDESARDIKLQITDFDLSIVAKSGTICRDGCGTLPFAAPEVILSRSYDPLAADIWSLGIVILEVLCGVRVIERALKLQQRDVTPNIMPRVRSLFSPPDVVSKLLQLGCKPEAQMLAQGCGSMLAGMLTVLPSYRLKANEMNAMVAKLSAPALAPCAPPVKLPPVHYPKRGRRPSLRGKAPAAAVTEPYDTDDSTRAASSGRSTFGSTDMSATRS